MLDKIYFAMYTGNIIKREREKMKLEKFIEKVRKRKIRIHRGRIMWFLRGYDKSYVCPYHPSEKDWFGRERIGTVEELLSYPDWEREFIRTPGCGRAGLKILKKLLAEEGYE